MTPSVVISGSGLWKPDHSISNEELVEAYNAYAIQFNQQHQIAIEQEEFNAKPLSSAAFIEKASGIKSRHVYIKDGILDINRMRPKIPERSEEELSDQAEMAIHAAKDALKAANKTPEDIDVVIVSCAYTQRSYPALAIEVQGALGIKGFAFDMLVACSAATFALHRAYEMIAAGTAKGVLVINPELTSPQINFCDRDSHFIFGDVCTAAVIEKDSKSPNKFKILNAKLKTHFSNNIRNNFGFMNYIENKEYTEEELLFVQNGRSVFKEVMPMVASLISDHLEENNLLPDQVEQYWLHQANINMNTYVIKKLLGDDFPPERAPNVLDEYANTGSAGSLISFHKYNHLTAGQKGIICSFGAGYSICSILVEKA